MLFSNGSAIRLPLTCPSTRSPPLNRISPSMVVDKPIRLSIVFFAFCPNMRPLLLHIGGLLSAQFSIFQHARLYIFYLHTFRQCQYAFNSLITSEFQFKRLKLVIFAR